MDWGTVIGTLIGATVGAGTTLLVDQIRWRRDRYEHELAFRREVFGRYIGGLSLTTHKLYDLRGHSSLTAEQRRAEAGRILTESAGYLERQQLLMTVPGIGDAVEAAFDSIHRLRELVVRDPPCDDATWERAIDNVTAALDALRAEMRKELIDRFGRTVDTSRGHTPIGGD